MAGYRTSFTEIAHMLVYLAARFGRRFQLQGHRADLARAGILCSSRWLDQKHDCTNTADAAAMAVRDLEDIRVADTLIAFSETPRSGVSTRGGRHIETGIAIALRKRVIVVGPRENVFCSLPEITVFPTWAQALDHLKPSLRDTWAPATVSTPIIRLSAADLTTEKGENHGESQAIDHARDASRLC